MKENAGTAEGTCGGLKEWTTANSERQNAALTAAVALSVFGETIYNCIDGFF